MRESANLAILFADIAGSTRLYEKHGDARAREVTSRCIDLLARMTKENLGRVVKTIGDEVMCTFPTADNAGDAAVRMQEEVEAQAMDMGLQLQIRVGFHYGEVIQEGGDVFGDAVNLAARMAAQAKADQIITTGETVEAMNPIHRAASRVLITTQVKGKKKPVQICEITWGEKDQVTVMGGPAVQMPVENVKVRAEVSYQDKVVEVNEEMGSVTLGRGKNNHFIVPDAMASRLHARVEFRRGRIYIVDLSANGTYVISPAGEKAFIHRDEMVMSGEGAIGLGREITLDDPLAVRFSSFG
ncbi:MAG: FHA domain-containing protein [Magnetococcales bacterium]|nr:FHA domain-containing protein [Magnetococcales bacterium]MBF0156327.1 FHA domain-containing protein [Magnetococcales bacterium]